MEKKYKHEPMHVYSLDERWFHGVDPAARRHLLNSLKSLEAGRSPTPSFKLYGKSDVSLVDDFFAKVKASGLRIPEWQLKYEMSRKSKFGPQGGYAPWKDLEENFNLYYSRPVELQIPEYKSVNQKYSNLNCSVKSYPETLAILKHDDKIQDRAAGWRDFNLKKTSPLAQANALRDVHSGNWRNGYGYVFSRFNKQKKRLFFPMPYSLMILEAQYYYPFLRAIQTSLRSEGENSPFTFWADKIGFDKMFANIVTPKCRRYNFNHLVFVQRDFEKMDTTQGFSQTKASMLPKMKAAFHMGEKEYEKLCDILYFGSTCPVATPNGMYTGSRGKASGENTTNGDETCSNEDYDAEMTHILENLCELQKIVFDVVYSGGNGDDGMAIYYLQDLRRLKTFEKLIQQAAEQAAKVYGYRINDKWFVSKDYGLYCQRMYSVDNDRIIDRYPAALILNAIVNPEKEYTKAQWDKDYRDLDIIEKLDNGKNLQYFHELVDFVDNGMKFRLLGQSETETRRILSKYERYRALQDDPFNYQDPENFGDITNSPTVKYLLAKRHLSV